MNLAGGHLAPLDEGLRTGSLSSYERLYREQAGRMKSIAANLLGNYTEAEDALHETFIKIFRAAPSFDGRCPIEHWAMRILVNTCHDMLRRRRPLASIDRLVQPPRENIALRAALEKSLAQLPVRQRTVFLLFEVEGLRHTEIASVMEEPEGTVRSLLFEARKALRTMLRPVEARA